MDKQLQPIHLVAYMLMPENRGAQLLPFFLAKVESYIQEQCGIPRYQQQLDYISLEGCFNVQKACWTTYSESPRLFWKSSVSNLIISSYGVTTNYLKRLEAPELAQLAIELISSTVNSVPSERAFSVMNFL